MASDNGHQQRLHTEATQTTGSDGGDIKASDNVTQHQLSAQNAQPSESGDDDVVADTTADIAMVLVDGEGEHYRKRYNWPITERVRVIPMDPEEIKEALRMIQKADEAWQKAIEKRLEALEAAENAGLDEIDKMLLELSG
ncbi:MAG: hypothetical protein Q9181_001513 [Wetmoreana brouardii]